MKSLLTYLRTSLQSEYSLPEIKSLSSIICCDLLGLDNIELYTSKYTDLSVDKTKKLQSIIIRLLHHEPIQYICGKTDFCDLSLKITPDVLIPRPETEELVALIVTENKGDLQILDIGTGSGCIAIALNKQMPETCVAGWDISPTALEIARINNKNSKTDVTFMKQNIFSPEIDFSRRYDIIVSNPPYVTESDKKGMQREVLDYEPDIALFVSDDDPLRYYRRIIQIADKLLIDKGKIYLEINQKFGKEMYGLLKQAGYRHIRILKDSYQNDRIATAIR